MGNQTTWKSYDLKIVQMRQSGYTLQEIGDYAGVTRERIRQLLLKHCGNIEMSLLKESVLAREIGCPVWRLRKLRIQGILEARYRGKRFHCYDKGELEKVTLALQRYCQQCGKLIETNHFRKYCPQCREKRSREVCSGIES